MIQQRKIQCIKNVRNGMFIFMKIYLKLFVEIILFQIEFSESFVFFRNKYGKMKINYQPVHYGLNSYDFILNNLIMMKMLLRFDK